MHKKAISGTALDVSSYHVAGGGGRVHEEPPSVGAVKASCFFWNYFFDYLRYFNLLKYLCFRDPGGCAGMDVIKTKISIEQPHQNFNFRTVLTEAPKRWPISWAKACKDIFSKKEYIFTTCVSNLRQSPEAYERPAAASVGAVGGGDDCGVL